MDAVRDRMKGERKTERMTLRMTPSLRKDIRFLFEHDLRNFRSETDYLLFLITEAVNDQLPDKILAKRQVEVAKRAEKKVAGML